MPNAVQLLRYLWAGPVSLVGLLAVGAAASTGGAATVVDGVVEATGGILPRVLGWLPGKAAAITLGHVVLATDAATAALTREHERVHVAQFERWGALFPALYAGASLLAWLGGGHYYRDNRFEVAARAGSARCRAIS